MTQYRQALRAVAFVAIALGWSTGAWAAEPQEVGARLKATFAGEGVDIGFTEATLSGSDIVLNGVTLAYAGQEDRIPIGVMTLSDVTEDGDNLVAGSVSIPYYAFNQDGMKFEIDGVSIAGLVLPPLNAPIDALPIYDSAEVGTFRASVDGKDVFTLEDLSMEVERAEDQSSISFTGSAEKFSADLSVSDDPKFKAAAEAMGLSMLTGTFGTAGNWAMGEGVLSLEQMDFTIADAGTIGISFELGGYTPEFVKALREMQSKMTGGQDPAAQAAALGLMQQLTFRNAAIRYVDDSLAEKALGYIAERQNAKPEDVAGQAKMMVPIMLSQLNNPEFTASVSAAVNQFLDDPQSIEIRAAPATPLPFMLIAAGAMAAPQSLPQQLGVTVTANETP
jgi:hypothetical protein